MGYTKRYIETEYPYTEDDILNHLIQMEEYEDYDYFENLKKQTDAVCDTSAR